VMKLSAAKVTAPGPKQVFRRPGHPDLIAPPTLEESRERLNTDLADLPRAARLIEHPIAPKAVPSTSLTALTQRVRDACRGPREIECPPRTGQR